MRDRDRGLKTADELLLLERGQDELLLANGADVRPLYVNKGRQYIREFLKAAGDLGTRRNILHAYPHETNLLDLLLDRGILVPQDGVRPNVPLEKARQAQQPGKKSSISLYLLLSQSCNMRCVYCLDGRRTYQTDQSLTMGREVAFRSIERCLEQLADNGRIEIIFFGGEPLLNWPMAKEAIAHCELCLQGKHKGKQRHYHVTSNLSVLPNDLIEWAKRFSISFLCDVDGPPEVHDRCRPFQDGSSSYQAIAGNIGQLRAAGLRVDLRATVTSLNQDCLVETARQHKELGGSSCAFVPVNPVDSDENILPEALLPSPERVMQGVVDVFTSNIWEPDQVFPFNQYAARFAPGPLTGLGCGAPSGNIAVVAANGDVYPCIYLVGIGKFQIGNVRDDSYPKTAVLARMCGELHVDQRDDCKACNWRYLCRGGCPLGRMTVQDNPKATPTVKAYCTQMCCAYTRRILETLLWAKAQETVTNHAKQPTQVPVCL